MNIIKVRFRVRKIEFTGLLPTVKGVEATVMSESRSAFPVTTSSAIPGQSSHTTAVSSSSSAGAGADDPGPHLTRRRSSSVGVHSEDAYPPPMTITGSINEDGLGAVSWWDGSEGDEEEEDGEEKAPEESMIES